MNPFHLANQKKWEATAQNWKAMHDQRGSWRFSAKAPETVFVEEELKYFTNLKDKKVAVLGSGDNLAVFAFAGLGAQVTSVDISSNQLKIAEERAGELGLEVTFVQSDVTDLSALSSESFDLVYTGGHVAVWVSDLQKYYAEAVRILKKGGLFVVNEYHPFRRVWKQGLDHLELGYDYYDRGPFVFKYNDEILEPKPGDYTQYEFHWRVSDFIKAILQAGCQLIDSAEFGAHVGDWEGAPLQGLPEFLLFVGRKG